ncbi:RICIN domain-containing protein [Anaerovorax odorimutans]|uniref:1-phosphatidylinositol phosphodiesterase n=1 Tax=Anaerovorax odorimutans TaxID=109327 RepID=A0ABT1RJS3_9FIRM|nr:MBG domain-containing protein [Anaerovorax odorimutans]MCQ4635216.1 RICIN domain-containing protein [Anaerovorax odorimutans]
MRKGFIILIIMAFVAAGTVFSFADSKLETQKNAAPEGTKMSLPTGQKMFLTLEEDWYWRWNINSPAGIGSVAHLDDTEGSNCEFQFEYAGDGYYGIKYGSYYLDVEDKASDIGKVLHLYHTGLSQDNQRFAFYSAGQDAYGNQKYYIQVKSSGYWVGVENNQAGEHKKIMQVEQDARKAWLLTPCTYPSGGEGSHIAGGSTAEFFTQDSDMPKSVNVKDDSFSNGARLNLFQLGTSCKMRMHWNPDFQAYTIEATNNFSAETTGKVWDVKGENGRAGTAIHLWEGQTKTKNQNTSQLWRLIKEGDGSYRIQNLRCGLYAGLDANDELVLSSRGVCFDMDMIDDLGQATPWMKEIPDEALLSSLSIPGTHDTGTANIVQGGTPQISVTSCQKYYFDEQLNTGIRAFDIRGSAGAGAKTVSDVGLVHGGATWKCKNKDGSDLTLKNILDDSIRFLEAYPSETLIMTVKPDAGTDEDLARALGNFMKNNPRYVWQSDQIPSMGQARGKIVFVRRFEMGDYSPKSDGIETSWFGPNLSKWDSYDYGAQQRAIKIYDEGGKSVYVQDAYNAGASDKLNYIEGTMKQTTGEDNSNPIPAEAYVYNYTSTASGLFPLGSTRQVNPWLYRQSLIGSAKLGIVMLNFADRPMAQRIYQANNRDSRFATKAQFPDKIEITYGDRLKDARLNRSSQNGSFQFSDSNYMPTKKDFDEKRNFALTFVPSDKRLEPVTKMVRITSFKKKKVGVRIDDKNMVYGDPIPKLTCSLDESQLAAGDTVSDLGIRLNTENTQGRPAAGTYPITGTGQSDHYDVEFENSQALLRVEKRLLTAIWSSTENLVYTGRPIPVTARFTNLLTGDVCEPVIKGGNAVGPSWNEKDPQKPIAFRAEITGLLGKDAGNYQLPQEGTIKEYYIERAPAKDYQFPSRVSITYGRPLNEAVLDGAGGEGKFLFEKDGLSAMGTVPGDVGTYQYQLIFEPKDQFQKPVEKTVSVEVLPKHVRAKAENIIKACGEKTVLDFSLLDSLALDDKKADLRLILSAGEGDRDDCEEGNYPIHMKTCGNANYEVEVEAGTLTVLRDPRMKMDLIGFEGHTVYGDSFFVQAQGGSISSAAPVYKAEGAASVDPDSGKVTVSGVGNYRVWAERAYEDDVIRTPVKVGSAKKRELMLKWKNFSDLVYDGRAKNVTAHIYNLVRGDEDAASIEGGRETDAGTYTAAADLAGAKAECYQLPQNSRQTYTIEKARLDGVGVELSTGSCYYGQTINASLKGFPGQEQAKVSWQLTDHSGRAAQWRLRQSGGSGEYADLTAQAAGSFKVKAVISDMKNYQDSEAESEKSLVVSLKAPEVKGTAKSCDTAQIIWSPSQGAESYQVYRSGSAEGSYGKIGYAAAASFTDRGLTPGKTYYYKVRACGDTQGRTAASVFSGAVKVSPGLAVPTVKVKRGKKRAVVTWSAVSGKSGYQVYRSRTAKGKYKKCKTTASRRYTDKKVKRQKKYYYKVRAYKKVGGKKVYGAFSKAKSVKVK